MKNDEVIHESKYAEEFEGLSLNHTFLLSESNARIIWSRFIDASLKSYHLLDEFHWLISSESIVVGTWGEAYNEGAFTSLSDLIVSRIDWRDDDVVFYCISKVLVIKSTWSEFQLNWKRFLLCESDSVVLVNERDKESVLDFTALGTIKQIIKK